LNFRQSISREIFTRKYMINGENSPEEVIAGIADEISSVEDLKKRSKVRQDFYEMLESGKLVPGGRIWANARPNSKLKNYNNCFTIDVEDSMEGIYDSLKEDALISKTGGGVGFNISKVRPKDDELSKGGLSSGPISFMRVFNESAKIIQTGGARRAAHIAILNIDHPDIEEFITVKHGDTNKELTQFNISVGITDKFIEAVEADADWDLKWNDKIYKTIKAKYLYNLIAENAFMHNEPGIFNLDTAERYNNGWWAFKIDRTNPCITGDGLVLTPSGYVRADSLNVGDLIINGKGNSVPIETKEVNENFPVLEVSFDNGRKLKVTENHIFYTFTGEKKIKDLRTGDIVKGFENTSVTITNIMLYPGSHTVYDFYESETDCWITEGVLSRGCGEICMPSYSLCCLASNNLLAFVHNAFTPQAYFDYEEYVRAIHISVRFLDNVLSATQYPLQRIEDFSKQWRRIGLGFTGLANALMMLGVKYGSKESLDVCEKMAKTMRDESYRASVDLAKEKGKFPVFDLKIMESGFIKQLPEDIQADIKTYGLRNIAMNTIAPNGCLVKETKVKTSDGIKTIENIFEENLINIEQEEDSIGTWYIPSKEILVETVFGFSRISKLYVNGYKTTLSAKTKSSEITGTENHHVLVKSSEGKASWKRLDELKIGDKILIKK